MRLAAAKRHEHGGLISREISGHHQHRDALKMMISKMLIFVVLVADTARMAGDKRRGRPAILARRRRRPLAVCRFNHAALA